MFSFYHIINFGNLTVHSYRQFSYCHLKSERQKTVSQVFLLIPENPWVGPVEAGGGCGDGQTD